MTRPISLVSSLGSLAALGFVVACTSGSSNQSSIPPEYLQGTILDHHQIKVAGQTARLEVPISGQASELGFSEKAAIAQFVTNYKRTGHGPLVMELPESTANPQLAVTAVVQARQIAWENGVQYQEMEGDHFGAGSDVSLPLVMSYRKYDAIAPDCPSQATVDYSNLGSNNELPTLGCAVKRNLASMISDPGDLLGQRPLDEGDAVRRETVLEKFRQGKSTASERSNDESGAISDVVE